MNRHRLTPFALFAAATVLSCSGNDGSGGFVGIGGTSTDNSAGAAPTLGGAANGGANSSGGNGTNNSAVGGASVGGASVGGAGIGGSPSGGASNGGAVGVGGNQAGGTNSGGAAGVGGNQVGGASTVGGGATGGKASGGAAAGGKASGGANSIGGTGTGGAATGGSSMVGGSATGGKATGGSATGGKATGGSATGGKATGGSATGGTSVGGSSTCPEGNTNLCGMLAAHNAARAAVSPAPTTPLPAMTWDATVAAAAQSWADQCNFSHYTANTYGQNLYASAGGGYPSAQAVVDSWVSEVANYNYAANTCSNVCGHYTQVVWRTSINLGCGIKYCTTNSPFSGFANWYIVVCNYLPPGNYNGQKPY